MKIATIGAGLALAVLVASAATAEPYQDYTPQKGLWHVTTIKVDPNHVDDYVTGLKKEWVPGEEVAKKHGLIDSYRILVKINQADRSSNVLLEEHIPSTAILDPDRARDQSVQREIYAVVPKSEDQEMIKQFDKYRTFVSEDYYQEFAVGK
jgi:hypothetical protein